ncbi:hypothetical protein L7F22_010248 [Adiantum nelumboides]|nr:hypothetical protein [Adiantum nelumboides]
MDDPYYRSRGKRSHSHRDRDYLESDGRHKKFISEDSFNAPPPALPKPAPGDTVFRLLCPEPKIGCVIGKGGSIVKNLRHETGAKIFIPDFFEGAEERVIFISSSESDWERIRDMDRGRRDRERDRDSREARMSPAQDALMQIHERILGGGFSKDSNLEEEDTSRGVTTRLLVPNSQVGCLLGKGGHIIEQTRQESKTQIRILPRDQAPFCSMPNDEIVQIVGDANAAKKALHLISTQLFENPPRDRHPGASRSPSRGAFLAEEMDSPHQLALTSQGSFSSGQPPKNLQLPPPDYGAAAGGKGGQFHGSRNLLSDEKNELVFRILCPREKIGGIIGKGGSIVRSLEDEIGVNINMCGSVAGSEERVVMISSVEHPDDNISPAQEALLHVQTKIADLGPDEDAVITSRLLISANQVACLLGTGGSIIAEMRRITGANIRILGKDDLPLCANPADEVVQIVGDIQNAREALVQVTKRLRSNLYYEKSLESGGGPASLTNSKPQNKHDFLTLGQNDFPTSGVQNTGRSAPSYGKSSPPGYWMEKVSFAPVYAACKGTIMKLFQSKLLPLIYETRLLEGVEAGIQIFSFLAA